MSAFLQLENLGSERIKIMYRAYTEDSATKDGELEMDPGEKKRGATCQHCSRRKGGLKSWEIVSVEVLPRLISDQGPVQEIPVQVGAAVSEPAQPEPNPVTQPKENATPEEKAKYKKDEDGEIKDEEKRSWEHLPPEFRPRD